jgi:hypothetical protein
VKLTVVCRAICLSIANALFIIANVIVSGYQVSWFVDSIGEWMIVFVSYELNAVLDYQRKFGIIGKFEVSSKQE